MKASPFGNKTGPAKLCNLQIAQGKGLYECPARCEKRGTTECIKYEQKNLFEKGGKDDSHTGTTEAGYIQPDSSTGSR